MYASIEYYGTFGGVIPADVLPRYLALADERIDTATFNRIVAIGFDRLTPFQKEKIQKAACMIADYLYENGTEPMAAQSYSVLDISVSVGAETEAARMGVPAMALEMLKKTGLCCRVI